jgi:hypothetical protein
MTRANCLCDNPTPDTCSPSACHEMTPADKERQQSGQDARLPASVGSNGSASVGAGNADRQAPARSLPARRTSADSERRIDDLVADDPNAVPGLSCVPLPVFGTILPQSEVSPVSRRASVPNDERLPRRPMNGHFGTSAPESNHWGP